MFGKRMQTSSQKAAVIPWSSVVGTGVVVYDDKGKPLYQLAVINYNLISSSEVDRTNIREKLEEVANVVADALNAHFQKQEGANNG